ncbi:Sterol regulatory element-binding protein 1 [Neolecta irregularis DAH-3]|uniref:Sterol regulatory element-binding protein 1 n=1 Tax=Neolecta irregularis (strain DAH-3) TaxID=1198029 RepID=A0A1U7LVF9_NEOID|nr:Sterol regulatory element-binding protein 1 [Neolecta irregularis DAH-3]|eukprot:OLL26660.1 Sterol regulatory element-binding protein 1 [Neolecta irregularis DAH-3]
MDSVYMPPSIATDDINSYLQQQVDQSLDYSAILQGLDTVNQRQHQQPVSVSSTESTFLTPMHAQDTQFSSEMWGNTLPPAHFTYSDWFGTMDANMVDSRNLYEPTVRKEQFSQNDEFSGTNSPGISIRSEDQSQRSLASDCSSSSPSQKHKSLKSTSWTSAQVANGRVSKPGKVKTSHNVIEKRYRNRINDKLGALRDCIPAFSIESEQSDKIKKGTVLEKATEYIHHLEGRNRQLTEEVTILKRCLESMQKRDGQSTPFQKSLVPKAILASAAGLMFLGSTADENSGTQGLAAIPGITKIFLGKAANMVTPMVNPQIAFLLKLMLLLSVLIFIGLPRFFISSRKKSESDQTCPVTGLHRSMSTPDAHPSSQNSSSTHTDHRMAFETAMQSVWVPYSSYFCLTIALTMRALRMGMRILIGIDGYRLLTNTSAADDLARQAAWELAIDAQLLGGDKLINRARLVLTFLASLTMPVTTLRLMTNALHFRVLSFDFLPEKTGAWVSSYFWNRAKYLQVKRSSDPIPAHLQRLLEVDPDELFCEEIVARMHSISFFEEVVLDDSTVRYPLDALSIIFVHKYAVAAINGSFGNASPSSFKFEDYIDVVPPPHPDFQHWLVLLTALLRPGEVTLLPVMNLWKDGLKSVLQVIETNSVPAISKDGDVVRINDDICVAMRCAILLGLLTKTEISEGMVCSIRNLLLSSGWVTSALRHDDTPFLLDRLGPLGMIGLWRVFHFIVVQERIQIDEKTESVLENVAAALRVWIGHEEHAGLVELKKRRDVVRECIGFCKRINGFGEDSGYVSLEAE